MATKPDLSTSLLDDRSEFVGQLDVKRLQALLMRASGLQAQGNFDEALKMARSTADAVQESNFPDCAETAAAYTNLGTIYQAKGDYAHALPVYQRGIEISEKALGPESAGTALAVSNLGMLHRAMGHFEEAEPLLQRALTIIEKELGPDHSYTATSLNNLAALYEDEGKYPAAEPLYQRALAIREKNSAGIDRDTAMSLNNLAGLYVKRGDYKRAEPLFKRALAISEKILPPKHPAIAVGLNNLATFYKMKGDYERAEPLFKRALEIRKNALGKDHPETLISLSGLGELYRDEGDYGQAKSLLHAVLKTRENVLGQEHPDTCMSLNNLALLYDRKGEYKNAEDLYKRALAICEKDPDHPTTAAALTNLAALYQEKGDYDRAESLYGRALTIHEKIFLTETPQNATLLNDLGTLYKNKGNYGRALDLHRRALAIRETVLGFEHPDTATSLNNLALVYRTLGDNEHAAPLYQRALAICEKAFGPDHPETAVVVHNLAGLYEAKGDYAQAESLYNRALGICETNLGPNHPNTGNALNSLAVLYWLQGQFEVAARLLTRSSAVFERNLELVLATGSEQQKQAYLASIRYQADLQVSFHAQFVPENPDALRLALLTTLQRKGRLLDAVAAETNVLHKMLNPEDRQLLDELMQVRTLHSNLILRGSGQRTPDEYRNDILKLEAREDELSGVISARSAQFAVRSQPITLERIQATLPPGTALVELVQYRPFDPKRDIQERKPREASRYAAYLLFHKGSLAWADLGEAAPIDLLVQRFRESLSNPKRDAREVARELDEAVMAPIRKLLGETHQIFISPDGQFNLVPFVALVDEHNRYLVEYCTFTYLGSGRDLLRLQVPVEIRQGAVIVADPDFEERTQFEQPTTVENDRSADFRMKFGRLPGTAQEAQVLQELLQLNDESVFTGRRATEGALKRFSGPRLLHIATHAFFLANQEKKSEDSRIHLELQGPWQPKPSGGENPLLRSGLALAGANNLENGNEDGILTALEVSGLDLRGTQLVVLSACETGLGDVHKGEGVYGLRRALVLAGSRTQIMSLWKVSDPATKELMIAYYGKLLKGEARSVALQVVQKEMLASKRWSHPCYWAAFILSGESGPLF